MYRGMNLVVGDDESEDEGEGNVDQAVVQEVLNPKKVKIFVTLEGYKTLCNFDEGCPP